MHYIVNLKMEIYGACCHCMSDENYWWAAYDVKPNFSFLMFKKCTQNQQKLIIFLDKHICSFDIFCKFTETFDCKEKYKCFAKFESL